MRILKILSVVSIAGILLLSFFSWYSADDLCNLNELARYSVLKMAWLQYMNWDGRSLSLAGFLQLSVLKYFSAEAATFLWAASFVGVAFLILKIVSIENPLFISRENMLVATAIIASVLWLGEWKLIPDIIYWPTGGSYSFMNLVGLLWLYVFLSGIKAKSFTLGNNLLILLLSLICGINSHNYIIGLIVIVLIESGYHLYVNKNKSASGYIFCAFIGLFGGALIVFLAPGNQVRLSHVTYHGLTSQFLYFYFIVLAKYMYWLYTLLILCIIIAWLSGNNFFSPQRNYFSALKEFFRSLKLHSLLTHLHDHKYLVAAFATISVFTATYFFAVPRTAIFFATFLVIYFFQRAWKGEWRMNTGKFISGSVALLIIFITVITVQLYKANSVKQQLAERENLYNSHPGMDVVVNPVDKNKIPFAFLFVDISADSSDWVNRCVALHHGIKTVRTSTVGLK